MMLNGSPEGDLASVPVEIVMQRGEAEMREKKRKVKEEVRNKEKFNRRLPKRVF